MTSRLTRSVALAAAVAALVACTGNTSPSPSPNPVDPNGFVFRATISQALPPDATFAWLPYLLITADGRAIFVGPTDAMFPGKLLPHLLERPINSTQWTAIVAAARSAGLLDGKTDFSNGAPAPGAAVARLQMVVDGRSYDLTGDPAIPPCVAPGCPPGQPGSQLAFAQFWSQLTSLELLGVDFTSEPYVASSYAILVGPPADDEGLNQPPLAWPLDKSLADFGDPIVAADGRRCGLVSGADADTLRPLLESATSISRWFDAVETGAGNGLVVRPLLPGETNPCAALLP